MGHQSLEKGLRNNLKNYGLRNLTSIPRALVEAIEKIVGDRKNNFPTCKESLSMDPCIHQWPKTTKQWSDTKDIPKHRDTGTARVKCSPLFHRCYAAGLGQLRHSVLTLLVGNFMAVVCMYIDEGSGPQLAPLCPQVLHHTTLRREGSFTACKKAHGKGQCVG